MRPSLADRLAGAVWGHLVGDAVGVPYEFKPASHIGAVAFGASGTYSKPPGTWSDDGALMLATLDSLLREDATPGSRFDTADQARRFLAWADDGAYTPDGEGRFDIGGATSAGLRAVRGGTPPEEAGGTSDRDNGNGSLMRILPLALVERDINDAELVEHAHRASAITHGHPYARATCALYVLVARRLLENSARAEALAHARARLRDFYETRPDGETWLGALDHIEGWSKRSGSGFVVDAFWSAWDALTAAADYRETIERAVRYGNDTDTTACIAGGLAGLRWGMHGMPPDWLAGMRGKDVVQPLVARLVEGMTGRASNAMPGARTSISHPIRVDWIDRAEVPVSAEWTGRLGMTFLPGKRYPGWSGNLHERDLAMDLDRLRTTWAVDAFVLLIEDHELKMTRTSGIAAGMAERGIDLLRFPIVDMDVTDDRDALRAILDAIHLRLRAGESVAIACLGGLGRTGTIVACLLIDAGLPAEEAITLTRRTRHGTIQSHRQEQFVRGWVAGTRG